MERLKYVVAWCRRRYVITILLITGLAVAGNFDNLGFNGNTISSRNTNGNIILDPNGSGEVRFNDLTASRVPYINATKGLVTSSVTNTELGYLSGVTSAIQTQIDGKQATGNYVTALTGDVTATGPGSVAATIANDAVTNAKMNNMAAWTFKARNNSSSGDPQDAALADLTTATPTASDYVVGFLSTGEIRKFAASAVGTSGGGGSLKWVEGLNPPVMIYENGMEVYYFGAQSASENALYTTIKVPSSYTAGTQINLKGLFYCDSTSGLIQPLTQATLIRSEVDDVSSTTNQRTSTNSAITMSSANDQEAQKVTFDLTSSSGQINAVSVSAGDLIVVKLYKNSSDTAACHLRFIYGASEVTYP